MALQSSGAISLANLQSEYGGSNPISLSEYYKNGSYVPSSVTSLGSMSAERFELNVSWAWWNENSSETSQPCYWRMYWDDVQVGGGVSCSGPPSYVDSGGYRYYFGTLRTNNVSGFQDWYYIKRQAILTTNVNTNVPTSGTISLSNFYGGRKT
jgi:hypothetical protein